MTQNPTLKPCPFCGETRIFQNPPSPTYPRGSINCPACLVCLPCEVSEGELIECWNRRTSHEAAAPSEEPVAAFASRLSAWKDEHHDCDCAAHESCGCKELREIIQEMDCASLPGACPVCAGDCASANPPVAYCPMRDASPAVAPVAVRVALTYGQKLMAEAIEAHFGERNEDYDEDVDDTSNHDAWEAFDAACRGVSAPTVEGEGL